MARKKKKTPDILQPWLAFENKADPTESSEVIEVYEAEVIAAQETDVVQQSFDLSHEKEKKLFDIADSTKKDIDKLTRELSDEVLQNGYDALRLVAMAQKFAYVAKRIEDLLKKHDSVIRELQTYGPGGVMKAGVHLTPSETAQYIYDDDPPWQVLNENVKEAEKARTEYQEQMKTAPIKGKEVINEETGELMMVIRKAAKKGGPCIKASIK